jgi:hypothetical protein
MFLRFAVDGIRYQLAEELKMEFGIGYLRAEQALIELRPESGRKEVIR